MRRRRALDQGSKPLVPMTPLVDIVFLLLIYFMLASNFVTEQQLVVDLPQSRHGTGVKHAPVILSITSDGSFFLNDRRVEGDQLEKALRGLSEVSRERAIEIRAERQVPVHFVVQAMDAAKGAHFTKVKVETTLKGSK